MRIRVRTEGKNINIPLPMWLIKVGIKVSTVVGKHEVKKALSKNTDMTVRKSKKNEAMKYINIIDYRILKEAMNELEKFKGLILVEVHSSDGTEVLITV